MKREKKAKEKNFDFLTVTKAITKSLYPWLQARGRSRLYVDWTAASQPQQKL